MESKKATTDTPAELTSWKEIAEYLGVHVRTAQKWERWHGLPVGRSPGPRGRVSATKGAIDAWMRLSPAPSKDLYYSWPLGPDVTVEVRFVGGPVRAPELDLLCEYLRLVKIAWHAS
jgi:hypothetical protein